MSLETIFDQARGGQIQELNLVLKADVSGSLEAFEDEIAKLPQEEVQVTIVHSGVGGITESDVNLAAASDAVVLGFNVRPVGEARQLADREGVEIRNYSVIYRAIDELRDAMQGMLAPEEVEDTVGTAEVRAIFRASRIGVIAGCYVIDGRIVARRPLPPRARRHDRPRRHDRLAAARLKTTCARSPPASSAASCSRTSPTSRKATRSRRTRRGRSSAPSPEAVPLDVSERAFVVLLQVHLFFPESGSLKAKRAELNRVKAPPARPHGRVGGRGRPPGLVAALDARRGLRGRLRRGAARRPRTPCSAALDARFPQGVRVERRLASWSDLDALG